MTQSSFEILTQKELYQHFDSISQIGGGDGLTPWLAVIKLSIMNDNWPNHSDISIYSSLD